MEKLFHFYFIAISCFSLLSLIFTFIYNGLMQDDMSARYPDAYKKYVNYSISHLSYQKKSREFKRIVKDLGDDKLNNLGKTCRFWGICCISILITAPVGMIFYLILV